ncbi:MULTISPECIES: hypothetical protein [unclassified Pseudomonas]|uniref:hypothetical protein n=1 Tax=unclassified Pseudomonas TaxID=196821 RepID=UPI00131CB229|nr:MULTISPECIES: hypothetical protein [unclassified Pseudomonas]
MKISTALVAHLLGTGSLKAGLSGLICTLYSGTAPSSADAALSSSNVALCLVSVDAAGTGMSFDSDVSGGTLSKSSSETWKGTNIASGTATFFRLHGTSDTGEASTALIRLQGSVALLSADLNASSITLVSGEEFKINSCVLGFVAG